MRLDYVERLRSQVAADPENITLLMNLGRACYWLALDREEQSLLEAENLFSRVLARQPDNASALAYHGSLLGLKLGFRLVDQSQMLAVAEQSHAELDRAVQLKPDSIEVREIRGYSSLYSPSYAGRDRLAIEDFSRTIELLEAVYAGDEERAEVFFALGDAYNKIGDGVRARRSWQHTIELAPGSMAARSAESRIAGIASKENDRSENFEELIAFFTSLIGAAIFSILAYLILRDHIRSHIRHRGARLSLIVSVIASLWNGASLWLLLGRDGARKADVLLALSLASIPIGLFIAYRFYRATFMDIVLKRGAALMIIILLTLVYAHLITAPLRATILKVQNQTLRVILFNGVWLWLYLAYPPLRDRIYRLIDRYLFKRRDYSTLLDRFNARLQKATDEASLKEAVEDSLKYAFATESALLASESDPLIASLFDRAPGADFVQVSEVDDDLRREMQARKAELAAAVRSQSALVGAMIVGPRAFGQGYLSEELSALRAMASQVGRTIESLRLQEARRLQSIAEEELRSLAAQAELKALRAQIDPHFFFNALNSVASLIGEDPRAAEELIEDLSDLFRFAFRPGNDFVTLGQELELIETYIRVEKARLGRKLEFRRVVPDDALSISVPVLTVQPLVENAVKHGIAPSSQGGVITLSASLAGERLTVHVSDTGCGFSPSQTSNGVGLSNVRSRLVRLYGESAQLRIDGKLGEGTTVSFSIPAHLMGSKRAREAMGEAHIA